MTNVEPTGINGDLNAWARMHELSDNFMPDRDSPVISIDREVARAGVISADQLFNYMMDLAYCKNGLNNSHILGSVRRMSDFRELGRDLPFTPDMEVAMHFIILRNGDYRHWRDAGYNAFPVARILDVLEGVGNWDSRGEGGQPSCAHYSQTLCDAVMNNWHTLKPETKDLLINQYDMSVYLWPDGRVDSVWLNGGRVITLQNE